MAAELRPFEVEIAERFKAFTFVGVSPKGEWIRAHLLDVGRDSAYGMWARWREFCRVAKKRLGAKLKVGTYRSFYRYVQLLRKIGLIVPVGTEPARPPMRRKVLYALDPEKLDHPAWRHPYQHLYPITSTRVRRKLGLPVGREAKRKED